MPEGQNFTELQASGDIISARNQAGGLVAARTGTTDTAVLNFVQGAADVNNIIRGADSIVVTTTAAEGTVIAIRTAGRYRAELGVVKVGDADALVTFGTSLNVAAGGLAAAPAFATAGILAVWPVTAPAAAAVSIGASYVVSFEVSQALARRVTGGVQGALLRFHAFGAAGAPAAGLAQAPAWYDVQRVADSIT